MIMVICVDWFVAVTTTSTCVLLGFGLAEPCSMTGAADHAVWWDMCAHTNPRFKLEHEHVYTLAN